MKSDQDYFEEDLGVYLFTDLRVLPNRPSAYRREEYMAGMWNILRRNML